MTPPTLTERRPDSDQPAIDPRFEARRASVERDERRRRRVRLVSVAVLLSVVGGLFGVTRSGLLDVDTIDVIGVSHEEDAEVIAASGIAIGSPLTDVDGEQAARRIEAVVPWVSAARVSRSWPTSVRIAVVERRPVAQVQRDDGGWLLVDGSGQLLDMVATADPQLQTIEGVVPAATATAGAVLDERSAGGVGVLAQMSPGLLSRMRGVRYVDGDVELLLTASGTVAFGRANQVQMKLLALETVIARVDQTCVQAIDVRVPRRPLVKRDETCLANQG